MKGCENQLCALYPDASADRLIFVLTQACSTLRTVACGTQVKPFHQRPKSQHLQSMAITEDQSPIPRPGIAQV